MKVPVAGAFALGFVAHVVMAAAPLGAQAPLARYTDSLPGLLVSFEMIPVPAGRVSVPGVRGPETREVPAFWISRTEVTWDLYDLYAFRLDLPREQRAGVDAATRPSQPYGAPDRGFGHADYPALAMTHHAARLFAEWLSAKTGHRYRLASDAEWTRAAEAGLGTAPPSRERLAALAWTAGNADASTHPVGSKAADALGLHDMLGNVAEWVTGLDGTPLLRGGSWQDADGTVTTALRARQTPQWNLTDPQIPKSLWWLSDGPFAGFRIVRVP